MYKETSWEGEDRQPFPPPSEIINLEEEKFLLSRTNWTAGSRGAGRGIPEVEWGGGGEDAGKVRVGTRWQAPRTWVGICFWSVVQDGEGGSPYPRTNLPSCWPSLLLVPLTLMGVLIFPLPVELVCSFVLSLGPW